MKAVKYRKSIGIILTIACGFTSLTNTGCDDFLSEKEVPRITVIFIKQNKAYWLLLMLHMLICVLELVGSSLMFLQS